MTQVFKYRGNVSFLIRPCRYKVKLLHSMNRRITRQMGHPTITFTYSANTNKILYLMPL